MRTCPSGLPACSRAARLTEAARNPPAMQSRPAAPGSAPGGQSVCRARPVCLAMPAKRAGTNGTVAGRPARPARPRKQAGTGAQAALPLNIIPFEVWVPRR